MRECGWGILFKLVETAKKKGGQLKIPSEGILLRVFIGESDQWQGKPLFQEIVKLARNREMAGATVIKGVMGFGRHSRLHTAKLLRLSEDLPVIIEIVDSEAKISGFIVDLDNMVAEGLVTIEKANVIMYRPGEETA